MFRAGQQVPSLQMAASLSPGRDTPASAQPRYIRDPWKGEAKFECALLHPTATGHLRAQIDSGQSPQQGYTLPPSALSSPLAIRMWSTWFPTKDILFLGASNEDSLTWDWDAFVAF